MKPSLLTSLKSVIKFSILNRADRLEADQSSAAHWSSRLTSTRRHHFPPIRPRRVLTAVSLVALGLLSAASQPAAARNLQNYELQWNIFNEPIQINGVITLDLDLLDPAPPAPSPLPYVPATPGIPPWVEALVITVPGSGPGAGTFSLSDYIGLEWENLGGTIDFDFNTELLGQGGWGPNCNIDPTQGPYCNFRLITDPLVTEAPYVDIGFQMYTRLNGGLYGNMTRFTPVGPPPTSSVPAPLPLAAAAAMLQSSRCLRRRVVASASSRPQITA